MNWPIQFVWMKTVNGRKCFFFFQYNSNWHSQFSRAFARLCTCLLPPTRRGHNGARLLFLFSISIRFLLSICALLSGPIMLKLTLNCLCHTTSIRALDRHHWLRLRDYRPSYGYFPTRNCSLNPLEKWLCDHRTLNYPSAHHFIIKIKALQFPFKLQNKNHLYKFSSYGRHFSTLNFMLLYCITAWKACKKPLFSAVKGLRDVRIGVI